MDAARGKWDTPLSQENFIPPSWLPQAFGISREEPPAPRTLPERGAAPGCAAARLSCPRCWNSALQAAAGAQGESGRYCGIHPHIPSAAPARSHLWGIPGVHGLHDGRVLQLAVDDEARQPLGQRVLGIAQNVPVVPNGTVRLPARASLVLQLRQPLVGLLPVIICEGGTG